MVMPICSARLFVETQTLVLTLNAGTYGSFELDLLEQLDVEFREWKQATSASDVIVDLSNVTSGGSELLGCLARLREQLVCLGKRLVVCGDQFGLIALVGWSKLMNLQVDLHLAFEHCVHTAGHHQSKILNA